MAIILDVDCLSLLERGGVEAQRLQRRLATLPRDEVATTIITFEEQMRGWLAYLAKSRTIEAQMLAYERLKRFLDNYRVIPVVGFERAAAAEFERLRSLRLRVGTMDLKIAAIALAHDALLLTRNLTDFGQVPNLKAEDWTR
jgi:tRNA(fMet)-specific endonuclease VapC